MDLKTLGFDRWFQDQHAKMPASDHRVARVTAVDRDRYLVRNESGEVPAEPAGKLLYDAESSTDLPAVGDWVLVQYHNEDTLAIIHGVFPRKSYLRRKSPGKKIDYQMIAANIDVAFIVQSCDFDYNLRRLERYLVMAHEGNIEPVILFSKTDLVGEDELRQRISGVERAGIPNRVIAFSNKTRDGLDEIERVLEKGKSYCLLGSSGVGKTTLLNHFLGGDVYETKPVREGDGKGRHVTTRRQLIVLDRGAMIIDTPGMRELGNIDVAAGIGESFSDIHALSAQCRFTNCSHTQEPGCAILEAIESGGLEESRYQSWLKLTKESEFHQMSYVEKRQKDKKFGQFIKSVQKHVKKKR